MGLNVKSKAREGSLGMNRSSGGSTKALAAKYFSTLSQGQLDALKKRYSDDFQAFQYDPNIFDNVVLKNRRILTNPAKK